MPQPTPANAKPKPPKTDPRRAVLSLLTRFEAAEGGALQADALLDRLLSQPHWSAEDRRLMTRLTYGTLRWWLWTTAVINALSKRPIESLHPEIRTLLRLGLYQLAHEPGIPDYAALDTTVALARGVARRQKMPPAPMTGFVNALLRTALRQGLTTVSLPTPGADEPPEDAEALSGRYYLPAWFTKRLIERYGAPQAEAVAATLKQPPPLALRVNTLKADPASVRQTLAESGIPVSAPDPALPESLVLEGFFGRTADLPGFKEGLWAVQDHSSVRVVAWLDPQPDETIVDLCAAPGSKTAHIAARLQGRGTVWAVDPSATRLERLRDNIVRQGLTGIEIVNTEGEAFTLPEGLQADRVLVDAPCSGTGTVRRHPDILIQREPAQLAVEAPRQQALLRHALTLVRPGGTVVYSTCSLLRDENEAVVDAILAEMPGIERIQQGDSPLGLTQDGFFMARLRKTDLK